MKKNFDNTRITKFENIIIIALNKIQKGQSFKKCLNQQKCRHNLIGKKYSSIKAVSQCRDFIVVLILKEKFNVKMKKIKIQFWLHFQ